MAGPPKMSKKTEQKEKKKIIEDKTFGLKNKNKSKNVQQYVKSVTSTVMTIHDKKTKQEMAEREQKRLEKLAQKKREQELKDLFKTADSKKDDKEPEASASEEGEDVTYDSLEKEMVDEAELSIEEIVEKERAKIMNGTPVTFESFTKWKQFKIEQQKKEEDRQRKLQIALYEKSGHGLSGRELFKMNEALFIDDDEADETVYEIPEDAIDEDLFLEDEEDEISEEIDEEFDPSSWKEKQTPKEQLLNYTQTRKYPDAKFEKLPKQAPQESGERISILIEKPIKKEFILSRVFPSRKLAEQNACLVALRYIQKYDEKQKEKATAPSE